MIVGGVVEMLMSVSDFVLVVGLLVSEVVSVAS